MRTRSVRSAFGVFAELASLTIFLTMIGLGCLALQGARLPFAQSSAVAPAAGCVKSPARVFPSRDAGRDKIAALLESGATP